MLLRSHRRRHVGSATLLAAVRCRTQLWRGAVRRCTQPMRGATMAAVRRCTLPYAAEARRCTPHNRPATFQIAPLDREESRVIGPLPLDIPLLREKRGSCARCCALSGQAPCEIEKNPGS